MKYSGIDLHSNNSVVTVTDEEDRVVAEKRLPNDLARIIGFLLPWRGNKYLSWAFVEAAYYAQRFCAEAKRFYERKKAKTNTAIATKALAHKLARACYHMLKEQKPFDAGRCFA